MFRAVLELVGNSVLILNQNAFNDLFNDLSKKNEIQASN